MKKTSITLNDCIDSKEFHYKGVDNDEKCWICSTRVIFVNNNDEDNEQFESITNDSLRIGDNGIQYHLTCANFWINFVDTTTLPHHEQQNHDNINDDHYGHFQTITTAN